MKILYGEYDQQYFKVPLSVIDEKIAELCKEWGIKSKPEYMHGMRELFDSNGDLLDSAQKDLERGKKWAFGDTAKEASWMSWLGD